jgi:hypothetical protein
LSPRPRRAPPRRQRPRAHRLHAGAGAAGCQTKFLSQRIRAAARRRIKQRA